MPTIYFNGKNKQGEARSFYASSGCLCLLGRDEGELEGRSQEVTRTGIVELDTITYRQMTKELTDDQKKLLKKYMKMFPFMRTVVTPVDDMKDHITFNVKDYTLNEVMFAIFHLRVALSLSPKFSGISGETKSGIAFMDYLIKQGYEFWEAYFTAICNSPVDSEGIPHSSYDYYDHYNGWDCSCFHFYGTDMTSFETLVSGNIEAPVYKGATLLEHILDMRCYPENIKKWLTSASPTHHMSSLQKAVSRRYSKVIKGTGATDYLGRTLKVVQHSPSLWLKALRETIKLSPKEL